MLWVVHVNKDGDEPERWVAIVLAHTEIGAKRAASKAIGPEYHSASAQVVDPYKPGVILTLEQHNVQYIRKEAPDGQW